MSKLRCKCGYVISDTVFPSPTEGEILCEKASEIFLTEVGELTDSFLFAQKHGNGEAWLRDHFGNNYPTDATISEIVQDLISDTMQKRVLSVAECIRCGRLHIQVSPGRNEYLSYAPDSGKAASILKQDK